VRIPFGPWEPDAAGVDANVLLVAKNTWPATGGYIPVPSLSAISTSALSTRCVGMTFARTAAGGWLIFAGTATKLYKYESGAWTDVSRLAGGDYNVPSDDYWSFTQFGGKLIAANINDDPQVIDVDSGASNFSALGGSPPRARYVTVVGDFVVLGALSSDPRAVRNSAINDSAGWTVGTNLCDEQSFADGGRVTGTAGGEYGYVLQEKAIRRMIFQPGSDIAFRYERVEAEHGGAAGYSIVATVNAIFFLSDDGFYAFGSAGLVPIGGQKVNKWFRSNSDTTRFFSVIAFADPFAPRIGWAFYSSAGSTHLDRVLFYDWQLNAWSYAEVTAQYWASIATAGVTLEELDAYGDIDGGGIPYPFDSRVWEGGRPVIGAVDGDGKLAFLEGTTPLTALFRTTSLHLSPGYRSDAHSVYPLGVINGASPTIRVGRRESTQASVTYTDNLAPSSLSGVIKVKATGRVHEFELTMTQASGTNWTHVQGLDVEPIRLGRI
jgi:hypothetical protein